MYNDPTKKLRLLFDNNNFEAAIDEIDRLFKIYGEKPELYDIRAMSLESLGFYLDAIDDYTKYLSHDPNCANVYFLRGSAKQQVGQYPESKSDFEKAIKLNPNELIYRSSLFSVSMFVDNPNIAKMATMNGVDSKKLIRRNTSK